MWVGWRELLFLASHPGGQDNGAPLEVLFPRAGESSCCRDTAAPAGVCEGQRSV